MIDPSRIAYIGDSLGAMEGTIGAALEPNVKAWYLNVNAGSLFPELAAHSPAIGTLLSEAAGFNFGLVGDTFSWSHPLLQVLETIIEPGDPISYAQYLTTNPQPLAGAATKPRNAVQVEVIWDYFVTDEGSEAIARAAGWGLATPNVGTNAEISDITHPELNARAVPLAQVNPDANGIHDTPVQGTTAVVIQAGPATHGSDLVQSKGTRTYAAPFALYDTVAPFPKAPNPYQVSCPYRELQIAVVGFFDSAFAGQTPTVAGFKPAVRDLDDDGTPDATDPDSNDPTKK